MYSHSVTSSQDNKISTTSKAHMKYLRGKIRMNNMSVMEPKRDKMLDHNNSKDELLQDSINLPKNQTFKDISK